MATRITRRTQPPPLLENRSSLHLDLRCQQQQQQQQSSSMEFCSKRSLCDNTSADRRLAKRYKTSEQEEETASPSPIALSTRLENENLDLSRCCAFIPVHSFNDYNDDDDDEQEGSWSCADQPAMESQCVVTFITEDVLFQAEDTVMEVPLPCITIHREEDDTISLMSEG